MSCRELVIRRRTLTCGVCTAPIVVDSVTNTDPECPELVAPAAAYATHPAVSIWWGLVQDADGPRLLVICSTECMRRLVDG